MVDEISFLSVFLSPNRGDNPSWSGAELRPEPPTPCLAGGHGHIDIITHHKTGPRRYLVENIKILKLFFLVYEGVMQDGWWLSDKRALEINYWSREMNYGEARQIFYSTHWFPWILNWMVALSKVQTLFNQFECRRMEMDTEIWCGWVNNDMFRQQEVRNTDKTGMMIW